MVESDRRRGSVPRLRLHDARHTCGTINAPLRQRARPRLISAWLGHADVAFTMRTYVHSQPDAFGRGRAEFGACCHNSAQLSGDLRPGRGVFAW